LPGILLFVGIFLIAIPVQGIHVEAAERVISDADEIMECLAKGEKRRHIGSTDMNKRSSRSHTIFRIVVESRPLYDDTDMTDEQTATGSKAQGGIAGGDSAVGVTVGTLNLVDLAGSESARTTHAHGDRLKEAGNINKSLLALSRVIKELGKSGNSKDAANFVSFRDSKLTRVLQPSLAGNTRLAVVCCISAARQFLEETRSTLSFASSAKDIKLECKINEVLDENAQMKKLQKELAVLKEQLKEAQAKTDAGAPTTVSATAATLPTTAAIPVANETGVVDAQGNVGALPMAAAASQPAAGDSTSVASATTAGLSPDLIATYESTIAHLRAQIFVGGNRRQSSMSVVSSSNYAVAAAGGSSVGSVTQPSAAFGDSTLGQFRIAQEAKLRMAAKGRTKKHRETWCPSSSTNESVSATSVPVALHAVPSMFKFAPQKRLSVASTNPASVAVGDNVVNGANTESKTRTETNEVDPERQALLDVDLKRRRASHQSSRSSGASSSATTTRRTSNLRPARLGEESDDDKATTDESGDERGSKENDNCGDEDDVIVLKKPGKQAKLAVVPNGNLQSDTGRQSLREAQTSVTVASATAMDQSSEIAALQQQLFEQRATTQRMIEELAANALAQQTLEGLLQAERDRSANFESTIITMTSESNAQAQSFQENQLRMEQEIASLREELSVAHAAAASAMATIAQRDETLSSTKLVVDSKTAQLTELQASLEQVQQLLHAEQQLTASNSQNVQWLEGELAVLKEANAAAELQVKSLAAAHESTSGQHSNAVNELSAQLSSTREQLAAADREVNHKAATIGELEMRLQQMVHDKDSTTASHSTQLAEMQNELATASAATVEVASRHEVEVTQLQATLTECQQQFAHLEADVAAAKALLGESTQGECSTVAQRPIADVVNQVVEWHQGRCKQYHEEISNMTAEVAALQDLMRSNEDDAARRMDMLTDELKYVQDEKSVAEQKLQHDAAYITAALQQLTSFVEDVASTATTVEESLAAAIEPLSDSSVSSAISELHAALRSQKSLLGKLEVDNQCLSTQLQNAENDHTIEREVLQDGIQSAQNDLGCVKSVLESLAKVTALDNTELVSNALYELETARTHFFNTTANTTADIQELFDDMLQKDEPPSASVLLAKSIEAVRVWVEDMSTAFSGTVAASDMRRLDAESEIARTEQALATIEELKNSNQELLRGIEQRNLSIAELQQQAADVQSSYDAAMKLQGELSAVVASANFEIDSLKQQMSSDVCDSDDRSQQLTNTKLELAQIKSKLLEAEAQTSSLQELQVSADSQLAVLVADNASLMSQLAVASQAAATLKDEMDALHVKLAALEHLEAERDSISAEVATLQAERDKAVATTEYMASATVDKVRPAITECLIVVQAAFYLPMTCMGVCIPNSLFMCRN
jgi:centromeric protein E